MPYSARMQQSHLYSVYFAPRGLTRMADLGMQIAQQYLSPFDKLIGIIGEAGSGKSMLVKGMFPGLELTNDDEGVNVRPLPILHLDTGAFYSPHTYHLDIRFESAFTQMWQLKDAILEAIDAGKRVVVEHFDLIFPILGVNAHLLIGVGSEIIVTRPNMFGPEPQDIADNVFHTIHDRKMAHSAEDLCGHILESHGINRFTHRDVKHGFILVFDEKPNIDLMALEMMPQPPVERTAANPWPEWPRVLKVDYGQTECIAKFGKDPRVYQTTVKEFYRNEAGQVCGALIARLESKVVDGRRMMVPTGEEFSVECDLVLIAAGFLGCESYVAEAFGVDMTPRGNVADVKYATSQPKVFVCGDMRRGQSLVVWALREGRDTAAVVDESLMGYTNL